MTVDEYLRSAETCAQAARDAWGSGTGQINAQLAQAFATMAVAAATRDQNNSNSTE
jgi:hypothetical protein